jgi:hypothetical protein
MNCHDIINGMIGMSILTVVIAPLAWALMFWRKP